MLDDFASQIVFLVPRRLRPCFLPAEASCAWCNRLAEGKEATDNQGQLQASAAIPRGGRTVEGRICLDIKRVNLV